MRAFLSRWRPLYLKNLVYMLQTTEYSLRDYWKWYHRTRDFSRVARRRQLQYTPKATLLLLWSWFFVAATSLLAGLWIYWWSSRSVSYAVMVAALVLILALWLVPYVIALPVLAGNLMVQWPLMQYLNWRARGKIERYSGVKIAVAGSYGKTTMKEILKTVLGMGKKVMATPGNLNASIGFSRFINRLTGKEEVIIFELGEYRPGDIKRYARVTRPNMGIITGVNEAHLNNFGDLDSTAAEIFTLADYLDKRPVYVNGDDDIVRRQAQAHHRFYSWEGANGWKVKSASTGLDGTSFVAQKGKRHVKAKSKLLGLHQIGPLMAAVAIAEELGLSDAQITKGIAKTQPFEHRLQLQHRTGGVTVIDDTYNGNPDGVRAALEFMRGLEGRRIYITPGLVETGQRAAEIHRQIGRELAESVNVVWLIRNSVTPYIAEGLSEKHFAGELVWYDDPLEAYAAIDSYTKAGDIVLMQNDWPDQYA
ncbi:UDP-N-acetylmuramoyl-tripeptide--D-alanyl-D-alanine ligase [Candidatus Microgenomates bacterium]|nr:UDP-N-acetylmuramoyl-tripeptide--D-alanyl-D-alanine ligase [Candidatus Microgenomates bacterium]